MPLNTKSPGVRRILEEAKEIQADPSVDFTAAPSEVFDIPGFQADDRKTCLTGILPHADNSLGTGTGYCCSYCTCIVMDILLERCLNYLSGILYACGGILYTELICSRHFTIRGPPGSDFEGGRFHGRITLPSQYPFKPPSFRFSHLNGRFEVSPESAIIHSFPLRNPFVSFLCDLRV